ncbi:hypothetical protein Nepgr_019582 [Nepenthes gracilis]|uniref:Uncharacterized protein n=1 Tax=Nepenthes gracilis TaxID=150966 RepID=A0AAD3SVK1_NEPGR|nr:hypothetical protein Nepgr_019582 [Nepenthes gracilis]
MKLAVEGFGVGMGPDVRPRFTELLVELKGSLTPEPLTAFAGGGRRPEGLALWGDLLWVLEILESYSGHFGQCFTVAVSFVCFMMARDVHKELSRITACWCDLVVCLFLADAIAAFVAKCSNTLGVIGFVHMPMIWGGRGLWKSQSGWRPFCFYMPSVRHMPMVDKSLKKVHFAGFAHMSRMADAFPGCSCWSRE